MTFTHLHTHSQYSILRSTASVQALADRAKERGFSSLAITDEGNLFGAVEFFKACQKNGVRPIIGCEMVIAPGSRFEKKRQPGIPNGYPVILLAKNNVGYINLCKLSSAAYLDGFYYEPRIDKEFLSAHAEGLICLSGGVRGRIARAIEQGEEDVLHEEITWMKSLFGDDFYLEIQRHFMSESELTEDGMDRESWLLQSYRDLIGIQEKVITRTRELSQKYDVRVVATNDIHYLDREDFRAHEILASVQSGDPVEIWERDSFGALKQRISNPKRKALPSHQHHFKTAEEMTALFADYPEAIVESGLIAEKCKMEIDFKTKFYPVFVPKELEGKSYTAQERQLAAENFLRTLCAERIPVRYTESHLKKVQEKYTDKQAMDVVRDRLAYELDLIISKGMCDYLLIVWDFIHWAKNKGIPMGPGRGSGAGSIILYLIGVTDIEPLRFNLFFERFINPERISYPDIDVDICMDRRSEVIDYTVQKYGHDKVAQIITFGTMKAKMAVKDVGRTLSVPLTKVNQIAKLIPEDLGMTIERALEIDQELKALYDEDKEIREVIDYAKKLEGSIRSTGIHAAGLIICGDPLTDHIPICNAKDSPIAATQYSMKPVESVGMLKIDFLGLKTLTSIQKAVNAIEKSTGRIVNWMDLGLEDKATFDLLNHGKTMGIFQLESTGMQELAKQLHIDKFEEIIAVGALYRPGPMEMIPSFINRKHGREAIESEHPAMDDILSETYGIMVYQEQVMQIASRLANFSLGEGDVLRRAMGKKDLEQMMEQREKFRKGALENGIDEATSMAVFDKIEKFASYGFNKSHAAAYGYLTYVTAYLKANYPAEWMAALMTCDRDDLTKVAKIIRECQSMHISILPPDVNESDVEFVATKGGIRFAMTAIKGVGEGIVKTIVEEREKKGAFTSLYDFFQRIDCKKIGKKVVENLIGAGCFDFTGWTRIELIESVDPMYTVAMQAQKETAKGIMSLFSLLDEGKDTRFDLPPKVDRQPTKGDILRLEKELLGFYVTGHPMDEFRDILGRLSCVPLGELEKFSHDDVIRSAFIIETVQIRISAKSQKKFAILVISDGVERAELPVWPELYELNAEFLVENQLVYAILQLDTQGGMLRLQCKWLYDLTRVDEKVVAESDTAFDRFKQQAQLAKFRGKRENSEREKPKEKTEMVKKEAALSPLKIYIDADTARLSDIVRLREICHATPGKTPLEILFHAKGSPVGAVHVDASWGVDPSEALTKVLRTLNSVLKVEA